MKALGGCTRRYGKMITLLCLLAGALVCLLPAVGICAETEMKPETIAETAAEIRNQTASEAASDTTEEPSFELYAQSAVLMDADSGRILYGKNMEETRPMASTTKIMTCILALERADLEDTVEVSAYAASMPDVQLNIRQGEQYRLGDLLYSLMLESHNDSAVAIAEHVGGTVEGFADLMNEKAASLGCENTWFITPNGLDASETGAEPSDGAAGRVQDRKSVV